MEGRAIRNGSGWWIVTIINANFNHMKNIRYILSGLILFMMRVSLVNTEVLSDNTRARGTVPLV